MDRALRAGTTVHADPRAATARPRVTEVRAPCADSRHRTPGRGTCGSRRGARLRRGAGAGGEGRRGRAPGQARRGAGGGIGLQGEAEGAAAQPQGSASGPGVRARKSA